MKKMLVSLMVLAASAISLPALAAEPTLHEVYRAADAGRLDEARQMMDQVLKNHPASAKAHYVDAEILARNGQYRLASDEFAIAEKLSPGLPFASPHAIAELRGKLFRQRQATGTLDRMLPPGRAAGGSPFPWSVLVVGLALVAFIVWASRLMMRHNAQAADMGAAYQDHYGLHYPPAGPGAGPGYAPGGGLGRTVLGGLAGGAALGAGMVAGEALMHRMIDGGAPIANGNAALSGYDSIPDLPSTPIDDLGGEDFGIADSASWDDGAGGGDDWN